MKRVALFYGIAFVLVAATVSCGHEVFSSANEDGGSDASMTDAPSSDAVAIGDGHGSDGPVDARFDSSAADASVIDAGPALPDIAHCVFWVRADRGVTVSGSSVMAWTDQSPGSDSTHTLSPLTAGVPPSFTPSDPSFNGKPTVTFYGHSTTPNTGSVMRSATWSAAPTQPLTVYVVALSALSPANDTGYLFDGIDTTERMRMWIDTSAGLQANAGVLLAHSASQGATPFVASTVFNHATSDLYINQLTALSPTPGNVGDLYLNGITVGGTYNGTTTMQGQLAELIFYAGVHDAAMRAQVMQGYLGPRYGIAISP